MKRVQFADYGGPEVLQVVEAEEPHAAEGQIRISVRAAGVNQLDWKIREGYMREVMPMPLPAGTGLDAAGVVDEVGAGVTDVAIGDEVFGSGQATFAEYAVLSKWDKKPDELSFEEAAGYPAPIEAAVRILKQVGVRPGETLLVSGASGGVGSAVVQVARQKGVTVVGTASERSQDYLRELGATALTYGPELVNRVRAVAPNGVAAALDLAGSGVIPELIELTGNPQKVLSIADFSAPEHGAQLSTQAEDPAGAYAEAAELFTRGAFRIPVERTFNLEEAGEAQVASAKGHVKGRFIVIPS